MNSKFCVIGAFDYLTDAELLRTRLEAEGIEVFLKDANVMQAEPFISSAIGGVKVMVPLADRERAEAIYNQVRGYAVDNAGNLLVCPNCKAKRMERFYKRDRLWFRLFPFLEPAKYKCLQCGMITRQQP
ncbi:putative signal transducing protein [Robiginitalea sediminis]|uniref:putative signal transducing protein n=1 Tax=Robiginitalea sediminis TaxID=1982593 RepID=UPI000B4B9AA2|nr:DUF2007 domain-containing protein [Robiginitalea sediminis]